MKTKEELDSIKLELQKSHKPLYTITIPVDDEGTEFRTIYLKRFDRVTLSAVQKIATGPDALKAVEVFIKNTYVGGDDVQEVLANFEMVRSLEAVVVEMISVKKASISKN